MTSLDSYKVVYHAQGEQCGECGYTGDVFAFWEQHEERGQTPDHHVCIDCLFGMDGRFKNQPPSSVLRKFEEITSINVTETHVVIGTRSPFGYYFHLHYTTRGLCPIADPRSDTEAVEACISLTGVSEIFCEDGDLIGAPSPYSHIAHRALIRSEYA